MNSTHHFQTLITLLQTANAKQVIPNVAVDTGAVLNLTNEDLVVTLVTPFITPSTRPSKPSIIACAVLVDRHVTLVTVDLVGFPNWTVWIVRHYSFVRQVLRLILSKRHHLTFQMPAVAFGTKFSYPCGLSDVLWLYLLPFVDMAFYPILAQVCRAFYSLVRDPLLLRKIAGTTLVGPHLYHLGFWPECATWLKNLSENFNSAVQRETDTNWRLSQAKEKIKVYPSEWSLALTLEQQEYCVASEMKIIAAKKTKRGSCLFGKLYRLLTSMPATWVNYRDEFKPPSLDLWNSMVTVLSKHGVDSNLARVVFLILNKDFTTAASTICEAKFNDLDEVGRTIVVADCQELFVALKDILDNSDDVTGIWELFTKLASCVWTTPCPNFATFLVSQFGILTNQALDHLGYKKAISAAFAIDCWPEKNCSLLWKRGNVDEIMYASNICPELMEPEIDVWFFSCMRETLLALPSSKLKAELLLRDTPRQFFDTSSLFPGEEGDRRIWKDAFAEVVRDGYLSALRALRKDTTLIRMVDNCISNEDLLLFVDETQHWYGEDLIQYLRVMDQRGMDIYQTVLRTIGDLRSMFNMFKGLEARHYPPLMDLAIEHNNRHLAYGLLQAGYNPSASQTERAPSEAEGNKKSIQQLILERQQLFIVG